jgi:hypothetical protein
MGIIRTEYQMLECSACGRFIGICQTYDEKKPYNIYCPECSIKNGYVGTIYKLKV